MERGRGDAGGSAAIDTDTWAAVRYADGRYYEENDGTFTSSLLQPAEGATARILRAYWTVHLPSQVRQQYNRVGVQDENDALVYPLPDRGVDAPLDATLAAARVEVELLDAAGSRFSPRRMRTLGAAGGHDLSSPSRCRRRHLLRKKLEGQRPATPPPAGIEKAVYDALGSAPPRSNRRCRR